MGGWYDFQKKCPKCGALIDCHYRPTSNFTTAECPKCGTIYDIILDFHLEVKPMMTVKKLKRRNEYE